MKCNLLTTVILFVVTVAVSTSHAADDTAAIKAALEKIVQDVPISSVKPTDINGIYEVESLYDVFYYAPKAERLIFGDIFSQEGTNLTARSKGAIVSRTIAALDLAQAVKSGSGKNIVIEFTDPDCPHCRDAFAYWKSVLNVTRYTFLFPIAESHPHATAKSEWILSQKDKAASLDDVYSGKYDKELPKGASAEGKKLLKQHVAFAEKAFVIGTPLYFVNGKILPGVNVEAFEAALLQEEKPSEEKK